MDTRTGWKQLIVQLLVVGLVGYYEKSASEAISTG
jgi:hypothetical protein